ncbi:ATP-dependent RNA helicase [Bacterioplanes sanyensis]|uniref:DEAD/DEAH box helicase n=1 Tax=Bacterioplanes sanyensis TaxID=1249553 RepID=UPI001996FE46|nr:DEAD/DEAH box helicase [Bacterioplanes sanyensis]GGY44753.1 ATP-dependent RNA helicase [Bacterioplanes sanyensis]
MFAGIAFHPRIMAALEKQGINTPTDVQQAVLPQADRDLQVCAETGSGKTLAYLLPVLQQLLTKDAPNTATRALILVPTRELARQVYKDCKAFTDMNSLDVGVLTGGEEFKYQAAMLRKNPEILVATTGRLVDHLKRDTVDLSDLEFLVLDEADRMLDMGFAEDMDLILQRCRAERRTYLLSATLHHEGVQRIAGSWLVDAEEITTHGVREAHDFIRQQRILADDNAHKDRLLVWLLANETYDKAIVFLNRRDEVERVADFLRQHREGVAALHGEMTQDERNYVLQLVRQGKRHILVATDVAARGLDVEGMDLVINYDLARKGDEYVHRIGRTGRAGRHGLAIALVAAHEWDLKARIERYMQQQMQSRTIEGLKARYQGPKKVKSSGKVAGKKKKPAAKSAGKKPVKATGKKLAKGASKKTGTGTAKKPNNKAHSNKPAGNLMDADGFAPIKRKK